MNAGLERLVWGAAAVGLLIGVAAAQEARSPGGEPHRVHALRHATIVPRPGVRLTEATVVKR